ncbi:MAG TPA: SIMPL domain-containing protein [Allosphingosinicella sp.]|jgi:uncharacterized protein YggE|nr:SIMPL domain-containing protein [Allosphingosinicella sp.]
MTRTLLTASLLAMAAVPVAAAQAQGAPVAAQTIAGTRLDIVATGEVTRVPDIVRVSAGVVTVAPTASGALQQNAQRMDMVRQALRRAGVAERDIQTSALNLHPDYRHDERGGTPTLIGYRAQNEVSVRFRDIANTGKILDALVAQGANQINGPMLGIDKPEAALDEARTKALAAARARADLYARATGKRVGRILSISEGGGGHGPMPMYREAAMTVSAVSRTEISPGEQSLSVTLAVSYELE